MWDFWLLERILRLLKRGFVIEFGSCSYGVDEWLYKNQRFMSLNNSNANESLLEETLHIKANNLLHVSELTCDRAAYLMSESYVFRDARFLDLLELFGRL